MRATFYNIGVNDIRPCQENTLQTTYADDNQEVIPGSFESGDEAKNTIEDLCNQFQKKNLTVNQSKSKEIVFSRKNIVEEIEIIPGVEKVETMQILGVIFDYNLNFEKDVIKTINLAKSRLHMILKLKHLGFSGKDLEHIYESIVLSKLLYGCTVWGGIGKGLLERIDSIQRRAVKFGIVRSYTPVREHVRMADSRLMMKITGSENHPLKNYIPKRTGYAERRLRERMPCGVSSKHFPHRFLKIF